MLLTKRATFCALRDSAINKMSLSIRPLFEKVVAECALCNTQRELAFWDSNLGGRICEECEPFLEAAEIALVVAKCSHPADTLVFRNP